MNVTLAKSAKYLCAVLSATCLGAACLPAQALNIVFRDTTPGGMSAEALSAFNQAAQIWSARLADPVTVYVDIGYRNDGNNGILGSAGSTYGVAAYSDVRSALIADATSAADFSATASLSAGPRFSFMGSNLDGTSRFDNDSNPCLAGPSAPCATNNTFLSLTTANGKALGFSTGTNAANPDGYLSFNAFYGAEFDFDRSDGIAAGRYDFVAIAAHEIGHSLGFVSGVDDMDFCTPYIFCGLDNRYGAEPFAVYSTLDLFRYSAPGVRDLRVGMPAGLSIDGGNSMVESFSTGVYNGDGFQASHFIAGAPNLMNPYGFLGKVTDPSQADMIAFDVIGWDTVNPIPEPETYAMMALGLVAVAVAARRRRRQAV
jgi:hypothetical protein